MQKPSQSSGQQTGSSKNTDERSLVVLDIKPKEAECDLSKVRSCITDKINMEGLCWGESK